MKTYEDRLLDYLKDIDENNLAKSRVRYEKVSAHERLRTLNVFYRRELVRIFGEERLNETETAILAKLQKGIRNEQEQTKQNTESTN